MLTLRDGAAAAAAVLAGGPGAILDQRSSNPEGRKCITSCRNTFHLLLLTPDKGELRWCSPGSTMYPFNLLCCLSCAGEAEGRGLSTRFQGVARRCRYHGQGFKTSYIKTLKALEILSFLPEGPAASQRSLVCTQFWGKSLPDEAINRRSGWIFSLVGVPQSFYSGMILFLFWQYFFYFPGRAGRDQLGCGPRLKSVFVFSSKSKLPFSPCSAG